MGERRTFQLVQLHIGAILVLLALGAAGLFTYNSFNPVLSNHPHLADAHSPAANNHKHGSNNSSFGGRSGLHHSPEEIRHAARNLDRQLLAKLEYKRIQREQYVHLAFDGSYRPSDNRLRVARDCEQ